MTTARVIPFYPHVVGRGRKAGGREPASPFTHLRQPRPLTPREVLHRQRMLDYLYAQGAGAPRRPAAIL
jgi:hypothetical protein